MCMRSLIRLRTSQKRAQYLLRRSECNLLNCQKHLLPAKADKGTRFIVGGLATRTSLCFPQQDSNTICTSHCLPGLIVTDRCEKRGLTCWCLVCIQVTNRKNWIIAAGRLRAQTGAHPQKRHFWQHEAVTEPVQPKAHSTITHWVPRTQSYQGRVPFP